MSIYRAIVKDISDPECLGRVRCQVIGFAANNNMTKWVWPCTPFAGPGYGFYCAPQINDELYVTIDATGRWIYLGFYWTGRNPKPESATATKRLFRTPIGHELLFDESGDITIQHSGGASIVIKSNGDIILNGGDKGVVRIGDTSRVHTHTIGTPHGPGTCSAEAVTFDEGSNNVKA